MARLIPKIRIEEISSKPEKDVARALVEQLSQESIVYHSYPWLREERNDKTGNVVLKEGEADFVIVIPDLGMLILEVKGGPINYDNENRQWFRQLPSGNTRIIKDPFEQARRNTHHLKDQIIKQSFQAENFLPCAFGYAVIFPDCEYNGPMPPGAETAIILSAKDLPHLGRRIPETLRKWCPSKNPQPLTKQTLDGIVKGLSPAFQLLPVLFRRIEEQEEHLFRLTQEQIRALNFLRNHPRAAIEGVAGSGKTLLAKAQAQRFADQGMKTLLVCYNKNLAEWLAGSMPEEYADTITVTNFHRLCRLCCKDAKLGFPPPSGDLSGFWRYIAPEIMLNALPKCNLRFYAIVVDEAQDFFPEWWIALDEIQNDKEGPFYLFYDPAQNLYVGDDLQIPGLGPPFLLDTNCRNTQEIAHTCSRIRGIEIPVRPDAPFGDKTKVFVAENQEKQLRICREIITEWIGTGKLKPSQIAIQSPNARQNSSMAGIAQIATVPLTEKLSEWQSNKGILFSTIRSFKGLEADAVVIVDVPPPDSVPHFSVADFYVATSRAKHLLVILLNSEGIL